MLELLQFAVGAIMAVCALLYLVRRPELAVLAVVLGVLLNLDLPVSLAGQPLNAQRLAFIVLLLVLLVRALSQPGALRFRPFQIRFTLWMAGLAAISAGHGIAQGIGVGEDFLPIVFNLLLFNTIVLALDRVPDDRLRASMVRVFPLGLALVAAYFLVEYRGQISALGASDPLDFRTGFRLRSNEVRNFLNAWAATLVLFLPLAVRPLLEPRSELWSRLVGILAVALLISASLSTFSRASLLVLVLAGMFGYVLFAMDNGGFARRLKSARQWSLLISALMGFLILGVVVYGDSSYLIEFVLNAWRARFEMTLGGDASTSTRLGMIGEAIDAWAAAPWFGYGVRETSGLSQSSENAFLAILVNLGAVGLVLYGGALWTITRTIVRRWRAGSRSTRFLVPAWWFMYIALLGTNDFMFLSAGTIAIAFMYSNQAGRVMGDRPPRHQERAATGSNGWA